MGTRNDWPLIFLIKPISEQIIWLARLSLAGRRHKESSLFIHWTLDTVTIAIHSLTVCVHNLRPFTRSHFLVGRDNILISNRIWTMVHLERQSTLHSLHNVPPVLHTSPPGGTWWFKSALMTQLADIFVEKTHHGGWGCCLDKAILIKTRMR